MKRATSNHPEEHVQRRRSGEERPTPGLLCLPAGPDRYDGHSVLDLAFQNDDESIAILEKAGAPQRVGMRRPDAILGSRVQLATRVQHRDAILRTLRRTNAGLLRRLAPWAHHAAHDDRHVRFLPLGTPEVCAGP